MQMSINPSRDKPITIVHIASGDLWAGAEVLLYHLVKEMRKNGQIRISVILLNHGVLKNKLTEAGIDVIVYDESVFGSMKIFIKICSFLRKIRPDIVHTHRQKENVLGSIAAFLCSHALSLRTVHGSPEFTPRLYQRFFSLLDWVCGRLLQDKIVAVSSDLARQLAHSFPSSKIVAIENGVDEQELKTASTESVNLPGPSGAFRIALVGRLARVKRIDIFLQVARAVVGSDPQSYVFYIFGDGSLADEIASRIDQMGLERHVHMMGFQKNMAAYLKKMNTLLITSDHEGLPMNLLEALFLEVPVIAHAVGGIPAVLQGGKLGTLIPDQSIEGYAKAITRHKYNPEALQNAARIAASIIRESYSSKTCADRYFNLYISMLTESM